jgi:hypothetical protein
MADLADDVGNAGLNLLKSVTVETFKFLSQMLEQLYKVWESAPRRALDKAKLKEFTDNVAKREYADKISVKAGFVAYKDLKRANVPLSFTCYTMTQGDMKELALRCKRSGIQISGMMDGKDTDDKKLFALLCRTSDLPRLERLIKLVNDEKTLAAIEKTLEDLFRTQPRTPEVQAQIDQFTRQAEAIRRGHCDDFNNEQAAAAYEKAANGETQRGVPFSDAMSRTGGQMDNGVTVILADATNPNSYIRCNGKYDTFNGKQYVKTTYEVIKDGERVYLTHDGRFEPKPRGYWAGETSAMQRAGGFGDTVLKFYTVAEYEIFMENWRAKETARQAAEQQWAPDIMYGKDLRAERHAAIMDNFNLQLEKCGAVYKGGEILDIATGKPLILPEDMNPAKCAQVAEAYIIRQRIAQYEQQRDQAATEASRQTGRKQERPDSQATPEASASAEQKASGQTEQKSRTRGNRRFSDYEQRKVDYAEIERLEQIYIDQVVLKGFEDTASAQEKVLQSVQAELETRGDSWDAHLEQAQDVDFGESQGEPDAHDAKEPPSQQRTMASYRADIAAMRQQTEQHGGGATTLQKARHSKDER